MYDPHHLILPRRGCIRQLFLFSLIWLSTLAAGAAAQDNPSCIEKLAEAEVLYFSGSFVASIAMLRNCLDAGAYDDTLKSDALRLLCLGYIANDEISLARQTARHLLQSDSTFIADTNSDSRQFISLIDEVREQLYPADTSISGTDTEGIAVRGSRRKLLLIGGGASIAAGALIIWLTRDTAAGEFPAPPVRP